MAESYSQSSPLWQPSKAGIKNAGITAFIHHVNQQYDLSLASYADLHRWSINYSVMFWRELWDFCHVIGDPGELIVSDQDNLQSARWFPEATLNYAENLLRSRSDKIALISQTGLLGRSYTSRADLHDQVSQCVQYFLSRGLVKGDRVAAIMPNTAETIVAMLAATSLGAVWTSVSPDFGEASIIERFGQTQPKILIAVDAYSYNGKVHSIIDKVDNVAAAISSIESLLVLNHYPEHNCKQSGADKLLAKNVTSTDDWHLSLARFKPAAIPFVPTGFNDPLFILYSSGTTGKPKCIVHRAGGVLLQHLKEHQLHCDIKPDDRVFYYSTCGWMMWNWLASALASDAAVVLYDESPFYPDQTTLFAYAEQERFTLFGTSASFLNQIKKHQLKPKQTFNLSSMRTLCSTGSVLPPETFDYVYQQIKADICLASISGGTDIVSCFVLGNPISPVYRGESQCLGLAMDIQVWDEQGQPLETEKGELVCCNSFPSQPLGFWGDDSGERYHEAYFSRFDNVWCHGDYVEITEHKGVIIYGRSDATLNPGGVRIGTAEIYRYAESLDEVLESVVIGQHWKDDIRVVLFVKLKPGITLDEALTKLIKQVIRSNCTPRHVPAVVLQVSDIPKTKTGKIVELAVREVVHNRPVKNSGALVNPEALDYFSKRSELQ